MSGTTWFDWRVPETGGRRETPLEDRAATALRLIALLNVPGVIVAPWGGPPSWLLNLTSVGATIGITALYLVAARAISRRRAWAIRAIRPLLAVITVFGLYAVVAAAQQGWVKVPIDAALAAWAWLGRPEDQLVAQPSPSGSFGASSAHGLVGRDMAHRGVANRGVLLRTGSIAVAVALLQATIWYGPPVFGWGGLLDVHERDLSAAVHVDCGPAGAPPSVLTVTYTWSWHSRAVLPSGLDMVVIGWRGTDAQGRILYLLDATPDAGPAIQEGLQAFPDVDLAEEVETHLPASWHWGIHLDRQAMAPGQIQVQLRLTHAAPPGPGPLTVTATYIHLGLWTQSAPVATCSW